MGSPPTEECSIHKKIVAAGAARRQQCAACAVVSAQLSDLPVD